jgi:structural maintenance of chromosome 4
VGLPSGVHSQDITDRDFSSKNQVSAADKSRISALDSTIETATGELEDIRGRAKGIEDEIKALEKKILDIGGARLLTQKSKVDGLKLHINLANDEITKAEVAKAKAEKDVVKFRKSIKTGKDALSEAEVDLEELDQEMTQCSQAVTDIRDKVEDAKAKEENSKTDLDEVKSQLDDISEKIRGFKKQEVIQSSKCEIDSVEPLFSQVGLYPEAAKAASRGRK